jgi:hypothetical protein
MTTEKDVNGSVSERSAVVLVLIDVINRLDFEGGEKLVRFAWACRQQLSPVYCARRLSQKLSDHCSPGLYCLGDQT